MKALTHWWIFLWCQIIGFSLAAYFGVLSTMWTADVTHLSAVILSILFVATVDLGVQIHKATNNKPTRTNFSWFLADAATSIGMIGTIIGFIIMVNSSAGVIVPGVEVTPEILRAMIGSLFIGFGTAMWTTLFGLIVALCIKFQLNNLETAVDQTPTAG